MSLHRPDGILEHHARRRGGLHRHASPLSLLVLGTVLAWALSGLAGSEPQSHAAAAPAARVEVLAPAVVRNGEFLEWTIAVTPSRPIAALAVEIDPVLWRELTINTLIPAAERESAAGGRFRFEYGALEAGEPIELKFDLQSNPSLGGRRTGTVAVLDGETTLVELPMALRVLP